MLSFRGAAIAALALCASADSVRASELYGVSVERQMLVTLDMQTGGPSDVGSLGTYIQDIAFNSADGFIYGVDWQGDQRLRRIDPASGSTVPIGDPITDYGLDSVHGMTYSPDDSCLFGTTADNDFFSIAPDSGVPSLIGQIDTAPWIFGLAYDALDGALYGMSWGGSPTLYRIDTHDASATLVGEVVGAGGGIEGLTFDPIERRLLAVVIRQPLEDSVLVEIDPLTAMPTSIGQIGSDDFISGLAYVPEPTALLTMLLASLLTVASRRRG